LELDTRVVGLGVVSMIISALVIVTIAGERGAQPVEVIKNEYPSVAPSGETSFTFALVTKKEIEDLQIRFLHMSWAYSLSSEDFLKPDAMYNASSTPEDVLDNIVKLGWFREKTSSMGIVPEVFRRQLTIGKSEFSFLFEDYSRPIEAVSGNETGRGVNLVYGAMMNRSGFGFYLEGSPGFIWSPNLSLKSVSISSKAGERRYVPSDQLRPGSGDLPLDKAPLGVVHLRSLSKDDTVTVLFSLKPYKLPRPDKVPVSMVEVIKVYVNGELFGEPIINVVRSVIE